MQFLIVCLNRNIQLRVAFALLAYRILREKDYKKLGSENFNLVADNYFKIISPFEGETLELTIV